MKRSCYQQPLFLLSVLHFTVFLFFPISMFLSIVLSIVLFFQQEGFKFQNNDEVYLTKVLSFYLYHVSHSAFFY